MIIQVIKLESGYSVTVFNHIGNTLWHSKPMMVDSTDDVIKSMLASLDKYDSVIVFAKAVYFGSSSNKVVIAPV